MKSIFVEENGEEKRAYHAISVDPKSLSILNNQLSLKIVQELSKNPGCALDLSRSLEEHEQKIYYHLRKLEAAGIIKFLRHEKRFGMTAKIYDAVSPVVVTKLFESSYSLKTPIDVESHLIQFFNPFIKNGEMNALIVIGDTYAHGKYDAYATEGSHVIDLILLLGNLVTGKLSFPYYKLDTDIEKHDLENNNLILIGNSKSNSIIERVNGSLPIMFNPEKGHLQVKEDDTKFTDPRHGVIVKTTNPFNPEKQMLVIGGNRTRGTQAAVIALTRQHRDLLGTNPSTNFHKVVLGLDRDGNKIIDWAKIEE